MDNKKMWEYNEAVGLLGLISAVCAGCCTQREIANYLNVSEAYLRKVLVVYKEKYGVGEMVDNYWIAFEPNFQIYQMFEIAEEIF